MLDTSYLWARSKYVHVNLSICRLSKLSKPPNYQSELVLGLFFVVILFPCRLKSKGGEIEVDPLVIFHGALENTQPIMGTTGVRRGGKLYHVSYLILW